MREIGARQSALAAPADGAIVHAEDLERLPESARRYFVFMGVVGGPRDRAIRVHFTGRFRRKPGSFTPCEAWQYTSGVDVSLWLTGESAWFALPGRAAEFELPHAAPLPDLLDSLLTAGRVTLCTQCAARREITEQDVIEGVRIAGAQVFVQEAMADGTQALVY